MFALIKKLLSKLRPTPGYTQVEVTADKWPELAKTATGAFHDITFDSDVTIKIDKSACQCHARRLVCVRCMIECTDLAEVATWTLITIDGISQGFYFCPRCGVSRSLTQSANRKRAERCLKWAKWKLNAALN